MCNKRGELEVGWLINADTLQIFINATGFGKMTIVHSSN